MLFEDFLVMFFSVIAISAIAGFCWAWWQDRKSKGGKK